METAALGLVFVLGHLVQGDDVALFAAPGARASLPCSYPYEDLSPLPELSVQWRSPQSQLLCHYIKHKAFLNCSEGYSLSYSPARISLTVERVRDRDYGTHLCSVGKRHEFTDSHVLLQRTEAEPVSRIPGHGATFLGNSRTQSVQD